MEPGLQKKQAKRLVNIRNALQYKLQIDASRLVVLGNVLEASLQSKDLEVGLVIVRWWKYIAEGDLQRIDRELKGATRYLLYI